MSRMDANETTCQKATTIGGQALIEGLMMIGPDKQALAVRQADGEIVVEYLAKKKPLKIEQIPFLRGSVRLVRQMVLGMKALFRSVDLSEQGEVIRGEDKPEEKKGLLDKNPELFYGLMTVVALLMSIGLFILLPNVITDLIRWAVGIDADTMTRGTEFALTLVEGVIRVVILLGYLWITRQGKDVKRVWQYHGSEHKTIACYEANAPLTVENVKRYSRFHPRCGTSFIFLVVIVSVIVLAFVGWHHPLLNILFRLLLLPVIAGISFELIRWAGKSNSKLAHWISLPGLQLQKLTTEEPDDDMIEVAIMAMEAVLPDDPNADIW